MSIIKIKKRENPFVQIDSRIFNDTNLSWKAKGVLAYLLSKPDNWTIRVTYIIKQSTDGRDSVYSALRELRKNGYLLKAPIRNEQGKITEWIEELYEEPNEEAKKIFEKQQSSRKKLKKKLDDESTSEDIPVDNSVDNIVDNIESSPLTENTEVVVFTENPFTDNPNMDKPNMDKPYEENPEILIIETYNNIDSNNIYNSNKENSNGTKPSPTPITPIEKFYSLIKNELSEISFKTWIEPLLIHIANEKAVIETKDKFTYEIIKDRYLDIIKKNFKRIGINKINIKEKND